MCPDCSISPAVQCGILDVYNKAAADFEIDLDEIGEADIFRDRFIKTRQGIDKFSERSKRTTHIE